MPKPKAKPIAKTEYEALLSRTNEFIGCCENSPEEKELEAIADQLDAYKESEAQAILAEIVKGGERR
jgi:hypothetical protein